MYQGAWNILLYVTATALLAIGVSAGTNATAWVGIALFIAWDVRFFTNDTTFAGRTIEAAQQQ